MASVDKLRPGTAFLDFKGQILFKEITRPKIKARAWNGELKPTARKHEESRTCRAAPRADSKARAGVSAERTRSPKSSPDHTTGQRRSHRAPVKGKRTRKSPTSQRELRLLLQGGGTLIPATLLLHQQRLRNWVSKASGSRQEQRARRAAPAGRSRSGAGARSGLDRLLKRGEMKAAAGSQGSGGAAQVQAAPAPDGPFGMKGRRPENPNACCKHGHFLLKH